MVDYNEYINKLKKHEAAVDFNQLRLRIEQRASKWAVEKKLALAGALAVLCLAFAVYIYYPTQQDSNGDILMSYVFEQESINGTLVDYVFGE